MIFSAIFTLTKDTIATLKQQTRRQPELAAEFLNTRWLFSAKAGNNHIKFQ